jgi:hypothetical protein
MTTRLVDRFLLLGVASYYVFLFVLIDAQGTVYISPLGVHKTYSLSLSLTIKMNILTKNF